MTQQDLIGEADTALSEIVHKKSATKLPLKMNGKDRGSITVKCEELCSNNGIVKGEIAGVNLPKKCFMKIFNEDERNGITAVYKSEVCNGEWKTFEINANMFCNSDLVVISTLFYYRIGLSSSRSSSIKPMEVMCSKAKSKSPPPHPNNFTPSPPSQNSPLLRKPNYV